MSFLDPSRSAVSRWSRGYGLFDEHLLGRIECGARKNGCGGAVVPIRIAEPATSPVNPEVPRGQRMFRSLKHERHLATDPACSLTLFAR